MEGDGGGHWWRGSEERPVRATGNGNGGAHSTPLSLLMPCHRYAPTCTDMHRHTDTNHMQKSLLRPARFPSARKTRRPQSTPPASSSTPSYSSQRLRLPAHGQMRGPAPWLYQPRSYPSDGRRCTRTMGSTNISLVPRRLRPSPVSCQMPSPYMPWGLSAQLPCV